MKELKLEDLKLGEVITLYFFRYDKGTGKIECLPSNFKVGQIQFNTYNSLSNKVSIEDVIFVSEDHDYTIKLEDIIHIDFERETKYSFGNSEEDYEEYKSKLINLLAGKIKNDTYTIENLKWKVKQNEKILSILKGDNHGKEI